MNIAVKPTQVSRRTLLTGALAGGFVFAFHLPVRGQDDASQKPAGDKLAPNAFIRIERDGKVTLIMPQVEMGQGIYTGLSMVLAEELDADFAKLTLQHAPPDAKLYANPLLGIQATGGSTSVRAFWTPMRQAGATTRAMLLQAAAGQWNVPVTACTASNNEAIHSESGRKIGYDHLVAAASKLTPPEKVALKDSKDFTLSGKPLKRLDTPDKVNGKTIYGIDTMLPGLKFATLTQCPVVGGKVGNVDDTAAKKIPGVHQIVVLDDIVAVVGDHMWAAKKGLEALTINWNEGPNAAVSFEDILTH